jgi:hypothetical protein
VVGGGQLRDGGKIKAVIIGVTVYQNQCGHPAGGRWTILKHGEFSSC